MIEACLGWAARSLSRFAFMMQQYGRVFLSIAVLTTFLIVAMSAHPRELLHIISSTLTLGVLCIGALQALLLAVQERLLHQKRLIGLLQALPSLEMMESLLFRFLRLGFVLLTLVLASSFWFFEEALTSTLFEKLLISILTWGVFAVLLCGRYFFGWRGFVVVRWTLGGVLLLGLTYFFQMLSNIGH